MAFELIEVTALTITNANPRRELHGEEFVRGIDISWSLTGENTLLDLISPGLRAHHYHNRAFDAGQHELPEAMPAGLLPLPNLKYPLLPLVYAWAKGQKFRGYRFIRDYGTNDAHFDFTDVVLSKLEYELKEGGSVTLYGTFSYNGDELQDNAVYGELSGMASEGTIHAKLLAPADLIQVKKGYRAGRPDTPASSGGDERQRELGVNDESENEGDDPGTSLETPFEAFEKTLAH